MFKSDNIFIKTGLMVIAFFIFCIVLLAIFFSGCSDHSTVQHVEDDTDTSTKTSVEDIDTSLSDITIHATVAGNNIEDCLEHEIPTDICKNNQLLVFTGQVTHVENRCNFSFEVDECEFNLGCTEYTDDDDKCTDPCDGIICDDPPEDKVITGSHYAIIKKIQTSIGQCLNSNELPSIVTLDKVIDNYACKYIQDSYTCISGYFAVISDGEVICEDNQVEKISDNISYYNSEGEFI